MNPGLKIKLNTELAVESSNI